MYLDHCPLKVNDLWYLHICVMVGVAGTNLESAQSVCMFPAPFCIVEMGMVWRIQW